VIPLLIAGVAEITGMIAARCIWQRHHSLLG
jgi:hypothetical protein